MLPRKALHLAGMAFLEFLSVGLDLGVRPGLDEELDLIPLAPAVEDDAPLELGAFLLRPLAGGGGGGAGGGGRGFA